jgi:hypothetical protein
VIAANQEDTVKIFIGVTLIVNSATVAAYDPIRPLEFTPGTDLARPVGAASPTGMVTPGFLPSRDTRKSLYIVGEGQEQDAEASPARIAARRRSYSKTFLQ